jgi:predicted aldo/keto reductase-like oxidoreductase
MSHTHEYLERKLKGGWWDAILKAKEEGKVKHLGFSGHSNWFVNNEVMERNLPGLEIMLVPVNVIDTVQDSFTLNTLPKAVEKNIGVIAMKPTGGGGMTGMPITWGQGVRGSVRPRVIPDLVSMREAQHFVYSMPVGAASFGCTSIEHVTEDIELALSYKGMSKTEREDLMKRVVDIATNNLLEHYKHDNLV